MKPKIKIQKRIRKHKKIRTKIKGTADRPRLCVFRSLKHIYAQLIDDDKNKVLAVISDLDLKKNKKISSVLKEDKKNIKRGRKEQNAYEVGRLLAEKAKELKIEKVVFDRGGFIFHGRIKAVADGARDGGLKF